MIGTSEKSWDPNRTLILLADRPAPLGGPSAVHLLDTTRQAAASEAAAMAAVLRRRRRTTVGEKGPGAQVTHHGSIPAVGSGGG